MKATTIRTALIAGLVGALMSIGVQGLAQHEQHQNAKPTTHQAAMEPGAKAMHEVMMKSAKAMVEGKHSMPTSTDKAFASMMAAHHADAIKMADLEIKHGKNATLKKMAKKMKDAQTKERKTLLEMAK